MDTRKILRSMKDNPDNTQYEKNPLEEHIRYFGGGSAVSFNSIKTQNQKLGDDLRSATVNAVKVSGFGGLKIKGCPFSTFKPKEAVGMLNHPKSTGIYNLDGTINEERWEKLLTYAENDDNGKLVIKKANFYQFLATCRAQDKRPDFFDFGLTASNAEWDAFFNKFADEVNYERVVPIERLRQFYEDSAVVGQEVEQHLTHRI